MSNHGKFTEEEADIVTLQSDDGDTPCAGWVNIGTHSVHLNLDEDGNLSVEVYARNNENDTLGNCSVTREASVEAGVREINKQNRAVNNFQGGN